MKNQLGSIITFIGAIILTLAIFSLLLIVMGTRFDERYEIAPAGPSEVSRQELALAAQALTEDAELGTHAQQWLDALGGVWVPWPQGAPVGYENPQLPDAPEDPLATLAESAMGAKLGPGAAAVGISAHIQKGQCAPYELPKLAKSLNSAAAVANIETSRQWLEMAAAHINPGERDTQLERIEELADLSLAQLAGGAADSRPAIVQAPQEDLVPASYHLVMRELITAAGRADEDAARNIANFACQLYSYPDAPELPALPGWN